MRALRRRGPGKQDQLARNTQVPKREGQGSFHHPSAGSRTASLSVPKKQFRATSRGWTREMMLNFPTSKGCTTGGQQPPTNSPGRHSQASCRDTAITLRQMHQRFWKNFSAGPSPCLQPPSLSLSLAHTHNIGQWAAGGCGGCESKFEK